MDPITISALVGAGASMFGSALNSYYTYTRNKELDRRDDTSIQRRMADLKAAGLNPYLALGQGAGTTTGMTMGVDTSQAGNIAQSVFDLKNQRETYKQNQLYTKLMENELRQSNFNTSLNELQSFALYGHGFDRGNNFGKFDKFGNFITPGLGSYINLFDSNFRGQYFNNQEQDIINTIRNQYKLNYNQSLFNLNTQNYQNYLGLVSDTIAPLVDLGSMFKGMPFLPNTSQKKWNFGK